jgi:Tol biopolymer transport system component
MNRQRDFDELIHSFVNEGPAELSPRLMGSIRDEVHGTRQRTLRRPWRTPSMPRPFLVFAVLAAIIVAFGAFLLLGPGGRPATPPSPAPVTSPSPSPTPLFTPEPSVKAYPLADGEPWIVLSADNGGATLVRPDGSDRHDILLGMDVTVQVPAWSPDGRQIVFEGNGDRGSQVWVANADGTDPHALMPTPEGCPNATCTEGVQPAWSPDGRSIAFIAPTHVAGTFTRTALVLLDSAGTTELFSTTEMTLARPSWSPDGKRIVLEIDRWSGTPEITNIVSSVIAVVSVDGTDHTPHEITKPDLLAGFPGWHASKDLIVFRSNRFTPDTKTMQDPKAPSNLYTIRSDGSRLTTVTDNPVGGAIVRGPTWTSDGRIMFGKLADPDASELLRVIDATGVNEASATGGSLTIGEGKWRPTP